MNVPAVWKERTFVGSLFLVLSGILLAPVSQAGVVQGRIIDQFGEPLSASHALLFGPGDVKPKVIAPTDEQGKFSLSVEDGPISIVRFVGVGHVPVDIPVVTRAGEVVRVSAQLMPTAYFGDTHPFVVWIPSEQKQIDMRRQADGSWHGKLEGKAPVSFEVICGLQRLAYPSADAFELETGSYSRYVSKVNQLPKQISLGSKTYQRREARMKVVLEDSSSVTARLAAIAVEYQTYYQVYAEGMQSMGAVATANVREGVGYLRPAWYAILEGQDEPFRKQLDEEKQPLVREFLARTLIHFQQLQAPDAQQRNRQQIEMLLRDIPVDSQLWAGFPAANSAYKEDRALARMMARHYDSDLVRNYFFQFLREGSATEELKRYVAVRTLRFLELDDTRFRDLYRRITSEFPDAPFAAEVQAFFSSKFKRESLVAHSNAPDFNVKNVRDARPISSKSLYGKTYLVDFWATWCGPCIKGLPVLHEWYRKYKNKGFEIVSFSIDDEEARVMDFHAEKFPMPWLNAWAGKGSGHEAVIEQFGVRSYPFYLLVDKNGKVITYGGSGATYEIGKKLQEKFGY